ncbi:unnamed protein product [Chilo suppressalis]|uniref:Peptidase M14 domain-containing protein n=1 Tax=Chilo suppressalis TaxID=168631 RepID=A0ABN8AQ90_CHISP|nr:unnamed protein product [Chilo suppressalis]
MANTQKSLFIFCFSIYVALAKHEVYEGHTVYEVTVQDAEQAAFVNHLQYQIPIDMWMPAKPKHPGQFFVSKDYKSQFEMLLQAAQVEYRATITNIKQKLEREEQRLSSAVSRRSSHNSSSGLNFDEIHRLSVVNDYLHRLSREYPNLVKVVNGGKTFEGRPMKYLKISKTNFETSRKPIVYLQCLLHAREWVTLPVCLYAIEKLVIDVKDPYLVNNIDWIIMPVANPDGYEFTHTDDRFWRKNRATGFMADDSCMGVDLNRNFDIFWGTASDSDVCSEIFHGRNAFSEPETQVIRKILHKYLHRIEMFIDLHSFGSLVLFGFGNGELPPNALALNFVGVNIAQAIDRVKWSSNPDYTVGNTEHILYASSGGCSDYFQASGVPLAFVCELPAYKNLDGEMDGFLVEPDFIKQAGFETWEGIKAGARLALFNHRKRMAV